MKIYLGKQNVELGWAEISEVFWTSKGIKKRCPMIGEFKIVQYIDNGVGREKEDKERLKEGKVCH